MPDTMFSDDQRRFALEVLRRRPRLPQSVLAQRHWAWAPDTSRADCAGCHQPFTLFRRRHHCRRCGDLFCSTCCPKNACVEFQSELASDTPPARVCKDCFALSLYVVIAWRPVAHSAVGFEPREPFLLGPYRSHAAAAEAFRADPRTQLTHEEAVVAAAIMSALRLPHVPPQSFVTASLVLRPCVPGTPVATPNLAAQIAGGAVPAAAQRLVNAYRRAVLGTVTTFRELSEAHYGPMQPLLPGLPPVSQLLENPLACAFCLDFAIAQGLVVREAAAVRRIADASVEATVLWTTPSDLPIATATLAQPVPDATSDNASDAGREDGHGGDNDHGEQEHQQQEEEEVCSICMDALSDVGDAITAAVTTLSPDDVALLMEEDHKARRHRFPEAVARPFYTKRMRYLRPEQAVRVSPQLSVAVKLRCGHHCHRSCVAQWIFSKLKDGEAPGCPVCRESLKGPKRSLSVQV